MVKHTDFKTCAQSAFCKRQQAYADLVDRDLTYNATYSIVPHSVVLSPETGAIDLKIMGVEMTDVYLVRFVTSRLNTVRFTLKERDIPVERYAGAAKFSIQEELVAVNFTVKAETRELVQVIFGNDGQNSLAISSNPFAFQLAVNGVVAIKFNDRGYFYHEDYRPKSDTSVPRFAAQVPVVEGQDDAVVKANGLKDALVSGYWEEEFNGHKDTKPNGPTSIGLDLTFPDSSDVYGLPEHASSYSLKTTRGEGAAYKEPYRLYNLDVFEHELDNPMALYGSVPFMMSHKIGQTSAILWLNAAEMWIDVEKPAPLKGQKQYVATHWMVESGPADLVFFLGPTQKDIFNAYTTLTGRPQLPQAFAIAYHQCRWNYNTQLDVEQVDANFDLFDIPYDVLWLDIEHTDEKKYFTWDKVKFADPVGMQKKLGEVSRKMVTIVDPHIKNDKTYSVSQNARELGEFVMGADNSVFEGSCWPGSSNWIDYTKESARVYWADLFSYKNYEGSTPTLYTWNDMNEPSVFSGPEVTMPKTALHEGGVEHRDVHNMYGMLQHSATYLGHLNREQGTDRPFILSRSFFAGTQRYGAIWTGDNTASWDYLKLTVPMLLNLGVSGITFCGADVGGFFGNPDPELLMRWYQIGALQPFFRAHAEFNTKRREPWLFGEPWTSLIRESVRMRYRLLPYLYTLFHEAHTSGIPIMRAMMLEFPNDPATFSMDDQFMLGSALVIKPVVQAGQKNVDIYLGKNNLWYDYDTFEAVKPVDGRFVVETPLEKVAMFIRGGSIIVRRDRVRRASLLMKNDPYTVIVALDKQVLILLNKGKSAGSLYVDDGKSFEYQQGQFIYTEFKFEKGTLSSLVNADGKGAFDNRVERIIVTGLVNTPTNISVGEKKVEFYVEKVGSGIRITLKNPPVSVGQVWAVKFQ